MKKLLVGLLALTSTLSFAQDSPIGMLEHEGFEHKSVIRVDVSIAERCANPQLVLINEGTENKVRMHYIAGDEDGYAYDSFTIPISKIKIDDALYQQ